MHPGNHHLSHCDVVVQSQTHTHTLSLTHTPVNDQCTSLVGAQQGKEGTQTPHQNRYTVDA